ncbi:MAG: cysteine desulfurase NifS [Verrucomicrobiota bacterium]
MSQQKIYYFDNNATTRVAPEVLDAMLPFLRDHYGNPSSIYKFGSQTGREVEEARAKVAALLNADPKEIVFTSCGTESNNAALHSALATHPGRRHILTTAVEHSAILNHCAFLQKQGCAVTFLPVDADGSLDLHLLDQSIRPDTALVSVMWANNETGVVFPIEEIAAICHSKNVLFHTDATQVPGKMKMDVKALDVDLLTLSAHKLHAPKGVGLLYLKRRTKFQPYLLGGHQEHGRRAGTENVASLVAFGRAAELALANLHDENTRVRALRDRLENTILATIANTVRNGAQEPRVPNTSNIAFDFVEGEAILLLLDQIGVCASSGSACTTGSLEPSHVLTAMGVKPARARASIRFSLGIYNTAEEVDHLLHHLPQIIKKLREISPVTAKSHHAASIHPKHEKTAITG